MVKAIKFCKIKTDFTFLSLTNSSKRCLVAKGKKGYFCAPMQYVEFQDLGKIDYKKAWDYQQHLLQIVIKGKRHNRGLDPSDPTFLPFKHFLLFCEHPPVYTLGKSGSLDHLLLNDKQLAEKGIDFYKINRGGDITFHGPGQIVGYPIFNLEQFFTDVHKYVRFLEEAVIRTLAEYHLAAFRQKGYTGVWLEGRGNLPNRKICAIGVHLSRWVTMHGFAFNVNTNLNYFGNIIPCGINESDKTITSLATELKEEVEIEEVKAKLKKHFQELFGFEYANVLNIDDLKIIGL